MAEQEKIHQKIQEISSKCDKGKYIFRGEKECYEEISSNLYRHCNKLLKNKNNTDNKPRFPVLEFEKTIIDRARNHLGLKTPSIEILAELQHYGGKTNLIDFTENIHVALFFACNGSFNKDGRIILFNTSGIMETPDIDYDNTDDYAIFPPAGRDTRAIFQSSVFIHAPEGHIGKDDERYRTVTIEAESKKQFLDYLRKYCGIEARTIYNDIQGFIQNQQNHHAAEEEFHLGIACYESGKFLDAIEHYSSAIELSPLFAEAYNNRGIAKGYWGGRKRLEEAVEDYDQAIELNPQYGKAYYNRGLAKAHLGRPEEAIEDYDKLIELSPEDAEAYNHRGDAKFSLEKFEEAIKDYSQAIELSPKDAKTYTSRGTAKIRLGRPEEAIEDCNRAIESDPQYAKAYGCRGDAKSSLKKFEEAIKDYDKVSELEPYPPAGRINRIIAEDALRNKKKQ